MHSIIILLVFLLTRLLRGVTIGINPVGAGSLFLLTRLLRGVTCTLYNEKTSGQFLLTRLLRGVTICSPYK